MTDPSLTKLLLSITVPLLVITFHTFYQANVKYKSHNTAAILKFRLGMLAVFLVLLMMFLVTLIKVQRIDTHLNIHYWESPLIILFAINAVAFGRFVFSIPDATFLERARIASNEGVLAHNESVLRELRGVQEAMGQRTPFNPDATIKRTQRSQNPKCIDQHGLNVMK